jgi:hypothetical protein
MCWHPPKRSEGSGREEPEHLPAPPAAYLKEEVEQRAKQDGISVNQFVATAFAEKLAAMSTGELFAERRAQADFTAFDRLMWRMAASNRAGRYDRLSRRYNRPVEIGPEIGEPRASRGVEFNVVNQISFEPPTLTIDRGSPQRHYWAFT